MYTVSSGNCPSFSCATSSSLLMLNVGPRGQFPRWRRSRKRLSVCSVLRCPDLWLHCSVSFVHGAHRKPFPAATPSWKLVPRPRIKHEKRTAGNAWEIWTVAAADGVCCARVKWEINSLLPFETAPFFCVYPVYIFVQGTGGNIFAKKILQERGLEILLQWVRPFGKRMCSCILHGSCRDMRYM